MPGRQKHRDLWPAYQQYVRDVITPVHEELDGILTKWRSPRFWLTRQRGKKAIQQPIQHFQIRDKRIESITDKFRRAPSEFPLGISDPSNLRRMRDILGARVIVYVPDQLRSIDEIIRTSEDLALVEGLPPRSYLPRETFARIRLAESKFKHHGAKPSGYASLHYFVRLRNPVSNENPIFEIQTRTMLEQVWGEIEHQLGYKRDQATEFSVARQFRVISHHLSALDDHFDFLYDRLNYLQERSSPLDSDKINTENLPGIMHDRQILLIQSEVNSLLRILNDSGITTVGELRLRLDPRVLDVIRERHLERASDGRPLGAFDVVPVISQIGPHASRLVVSAAFDDAVESGELVRQLRAETRERRKAHQGRQPEGF